jgi:5-methylcytosine-specific restriction protein A
MALADLTREAVLKAVGEFDRLGRTEFLEKYGFGSARSYFLEVDGRLYDSKAIAGAAHGFIRNGVHPLRSTDFSGGETTVMATLERLGFEFAKDETSVRNPPWSRDELILALDLYLMSRASPPGKSSKAVLELSDVLNRLGSQLGQQRQVTYRNANGVYMKMMNFRRFDPTVTEAGKVGLQRGGKDEEAVWNEFADQPDRLHQVANLLRSTIALPASEQPEPYDEDGTVEAEEGRILTRLHRSRERSRKLVDERKRKAMAATGSLRCEACDFDFAARYGQRGQGFIEAHHTKPVHSLEPGATTKLVDLALLCANCHRMVHSARPWLSIDQLRQLITKPQPS